MENLFKSHDFYLSSCLVAAKLPLKRLEKGEGKLVIFVFDDPKHQAEQLISSHWNRTLCLPTRDLIEAINELKTRLYSGF